MMRHSIRLKLILTVIFLLSISAYSVHASDFGYSFVKSGLGARPLGMGGTFAAICDDATAAVWNPAGLAQVDSRQAAMMYSNEFDMDIYLNYVGYVQPVSYFGSFGFTYAQLNTGFVPVTTTKDAYGRPIVEGYLHDNESTFVLSWAKDMARRKAAMGLNVKFLSQTFGDNHGRGVDLDLGFLFKPTDNFSIGITLQDFLIGKMNWDGVDDNLELTVKTGIAGKFFNNRVVVGIDADFSQHRPVMWHIGSEYNLNRNFALRFGSDDGNLTGGTSIKMKNWIFDYAYQDHDLGPTHRVSARIDFDHEWPWRENFRRRSKMRPLEPAKKVLVRVEEVDTTEAEPKVRVIEPRTPGQEAVPVAEPMVDSREKLLKYYVDLAERYSVTAKYDEAIPIYKKILKIDPNRPDILIKLGQAYKYKMDYVRANRVFGYIIKRYPSSPFREKAMSEMVGDSASNMGELKGEKLSLIAPGSTEDLLKDKLFQEETQAIAVDGSASETVQEPESLGKGEANDQVAAVENVKQPEKLAVSDRKKVQSLPVPAVKPAETVKLAVVEKKIPEQQQNAAPHKADVPQEKKNESGTVAFKVDRGAGNDTEKNALPKFPVNVETAAEVAKGQPAAVPVKAPGTPVTAEKTNRNVAAAAGASDAKEEATVVKAGQETQVASVVQAKEPGVREPQLIAEKPDAMPAAEKSNVSAQILKLAINTAEKTSPEVQEKPADQPVTAAAALIPEAETKSQFNDDRLVSHYYKKGNEYYMNGEYSKAIVLYEKVLERRKDSVGIRFILGNNYILDKKFDKAREMYEYIINLDPSSKVGTRAKILLKKLDNM